MNPCILKHVYAYFHASVRMCTIIPCVCVCMCVCACIRPSVSGPVCNTCYTIHGTLYYISGGSTYVANAGFMIHDSAGNYMWFCITPYGVSDARLIAMGKRGYYVRPTESHAGVRQLYNHWTNCILYMYKMTWLKCILWGTRFPPTLCW